MSKEIIIRLRDDLDDSVRDDIDTYEFGFRGVQYEIDLHPDNLAKLEQAFAEYVKVAREVKPKRKTRTRAKAAKDVAPQPTTTTATGSWAGQVRAYATNLGYDWDDKAQRSAVRIWGGLNKVGVIPRRVIDGHHAARTSGEIPWPPKS